MEADNTRHAWAWRDLARTLKWLGHSATEVENGYNRAIELLPTEPRFREEVENWKRQNRL